MSTKYRAKDTLLIQTTGLEIELDLAIDYSVSRYRAATLTQPEEPRTVEIEDVRAFRDKVEIVLPNWIDDAIDNDALKARLLEEASEQDCAAAEDAAESRREREWEDEIPW